MVHNIRARTVMLGLKNVDIIRLLYKRGITTNPQIYSNAINGLMRSPKAIKITTEADKLLKEMEKERGIDYATIKTKNRG